VGKMSAIGQPARQTQRSIPSGLVIHVNYMDYGGGDHTADQGGVWLVGGIGQSVIAGLAYGLYSCTSAVCDMDSAAAAAVCLCFCLWHEHEM